MNDEKLDEIIKQLKIISKWSKLQGMNSLKQVLLTSLKTDTEKAAYELSDGIKTTREIAKEIDINSKSTIIGYWQKWYKAGIVEESDKYKGRMKHFVSLDEIGIEPPSLLQKQKKSKGGAK